MDLSCKGYRLKSGIKVKLNDYVEELKDKVGTVVGCGYKMASVNISEGNTITVPTQDLSFTDNAEYLLNFMSDEMLIAYRTGKHAEWCEAMESVDAEWIPYPCECEAEYHKHCFYHRYEVIDKELWVHAMECDEDGNHEIADSANVLSADYDYLEKTYFLSADEIEYEWNTYIRWVSMSGNDVLNEIILMHSETEGLNEEDLKEYIKAKARALVKDYPRYYVIAREVWTKEVVVEANSPEEACKLYKENNLRKVKVMKPSKFDYTNELYVYANEDFNCMKPLHIDIL